MKRREFIQTGICLGCAGVICAAGFYKKFLQGKDNISPQDFIIKSEDELPKKIRLDVCNLCQLNCPACWMRTNEEKIKNDGGGYGYVSFETYKNLLDKYPFIKEIEISNNGEIFLNPDLEDIIRYSYEKGVVLTAWGGANLNTLSESVAEALVKYKFKHITVSIDGATPETYKIYRRGGDFNTVINNIKMINKYKKKYNSEYPELLYKFILFGHNEHEIEKAKKLAKELNMKSAFSANFFPEYSPLKNKEKAYQQAGHVLDEENDVNSWFPCVDMFLKPQFNFNGDLFGCCTLFMPPYGTNIFKDGFLNALNSPKYLYAKMMLTDFSVEPKSKIPCSDCKYYFVLKDKNHPMTKENLENV